MNQPRLDPYLTFNGNCEEAMKFYQSVLGGELKINRFGEFDSPQIPVPDAQKDKVMHSVLKNELLNLMASDSRPEQPVTFGENISLSIAGTDEAQLTTFFNELSNGGKVTMPFAKQIWGDMFGMCTDKYGVHWMINVGLGDWE